MGKVEEGRRGLEREVESGGEKKRVGDREDRILRERRW